MARSRRLTELSERVAAALESVQPPLVLALSGGADSAALTWVATDRSVPAVAVHIHHGWPDSDRMEAAARAVADRTGIELAVLRVDASAAGSPEAVARAARYAALGEFAAGRTVVTAHTLDDQAETVLGNVLWGTGLDGLRGIDVHGTRAARPLLGISRGELRELAVLAGLPFVDDPANDETRYRRVRIRRALAEMEISIASGTRERLGALAEAARADVEYLERAASDIAVEVAGGSARISTGALTTSHRSLAARAVRRALRVLGDGYAGTADDVDRVLAVAAGSAATELTGGLRAERSGAYVTIGTRVVDGTSDAVRLVDGLRSGAFVWRIDRGQGRPPAFPLSRWAQVFTESSLAGAIVRPADRRDRIALRSGHKPVFEALAEAGVVAEERPSWPVVVVDEEPVWIPGARRAPVGWVTEPAGRYVVLSAEREERWKPVEY